MLNGPRVFIALRHIEMTFKTGMPTLKGCLEKRQNLSMPTEDVLHEHHRMYCMTDVAEL